MPARLTRPQARRIALAAQGFGLPRPENVTMRQVQQVIDRVAQFQVDSVNVAVRAQLMPLFSRLGSYDPALLTRAAEQPPRRLFEYWGHAACLIDVSLQPAFRMRMRRRADPERSGARRLLAEKPELLARIRNDLRTGGPLTARDIDHVEQRTRDHWGWNWSEAKHVLEYLFSSGEIAVAGRNQAFERLYDLAERVIPAVVFATPDPTEEESLDILVGRSGRALGVADIAALADYFYLDRAATAASVQRLVTAGLLEEVSVADLPGTYWLWVGARRPRAIRGQALISPFDSFAFQRDRLLRLFDVDYRIEIYVPAAKRRFGYYCYLFLLDDQVVGRVDLKAERQAGVLVVQAAWIEDAHHHRAGEIAPSLASELRLMARWLGLEEVAVRPVGSLAADLSVATTLSA